ncbi:MAG: hypothetical protein Q9182_003002 [Xanthomendoza sp. 2 TL-2023]
MLSKAAEDILRRYMEQNSEPPTAITILPDIECLLKLRAIIFDFMETTEKGAKITLEEWNKRRLEEKYKDLACDGLSLEEIFNEVVLVPVVPLPPAADAPISSTAMAIENPQPTASLMMIVYQPTIKPANGSRIKNFTLMHSARLVTELEQLGREKARWKQLYRFLSHDRDEEQHEKYLSWESTMQKKEEGAPKPATSVEGPGIQPQPYSECLPLATRKGLYVYKLVKERASHLL